VRDRRVHLPWRVCAAGGAERAGSVPDVLGWHLHARRCMPRTSPGCAGRPLGARGECERLPAIKLRGSLLFHAQEAPLSEVRGGVLRRTHQQATNADVRWDDGHAQSVRHMFRFGRAGQREKAAGSISMILCRRSTVAHLSVMNLRRKCEAELPV